MPAGRPSKQTPAPGGPVVYSMENHPNREDPYIKKLFDRFMDKVHTIPETACWWWVGAALPAGYGLTRVSGEKWLAHRLSYMIHTGYHPAGYVVMHTCDNPCCVNPHHLRLGSQQDNISDMIAKGRAHHGRG